MFLLHKYCIIYNAHASFYCFVLGNRICMSFISIFTVFLYLQAVVALHVWGKFIFSHFYSKKMSALVLCHVEAISLNSRFVLCDAIDILQQRKCESISYDHQHLLCVALAWPLLHDKYFKHWRLPDILWKTLTFNKLHVDYLLRVYSWPQQFTRHRFHNRCKPKLWIELKAVCQGWYSHAIYFWRYFHFCKMSRDWCRICSASMANSVSGTVLTVQRRECLALCQ